MMVHTLLDGNCPKLVRHLNKARDRGIEHQLPQLRYAKINRQIAGCTCSAVRISMYFGLRLCRYTGPVPPSDGEKLLFSILAL